MSLIWWFINVMMVILVIVTFSKGRNDILPIENNSTAMKLAQDINIFCIVTTHPENHYKKAIHVKNTWGKRCTKLLFMSSQTDNELGAVNVSEVESRDILWYKTRQSFKYIYEHHRNEADWFLKADDDTYVILENLRYLLLGYNPWEPSYFGCQHRYYTSQGYMSGGAGYVLSRSALDLFIKVALPSKYLCKEKPKGAEDIELGKCLANVGVKVQDSRDAFGRSRFFQYVPLTHLLLDRGQTLEEAEWWKDLWYRIELVCFA